MRETWKLQVEAPVPTRWCRLVGGIPKQCLFKGGGIKGDARPKRYNWSREDKYFWEKLALIKRSMFVLWPSWAKNQLRESDLQKNGSLIGKIQ